MADQTRLPPKIERAVGALTHQARKAWHNGPGPAVLGKIGFWVALPGLDATYQRHLAVLGLSRRTLAEVATSAKKLELQIRELERQAAHVADHSQEEGAGERQAAGNVAATLAGLRRDYAEAKAREERVSAASRQLMRHIDAFRLSRNAVQAAHTAVEEAAQSVWAEITVPSLGQQAEPPE